MNKLFKRILTVGASLALAAVAAVPALAEEIPNPTVTNAVINVDKIVQSLTADDFPQSTDSYTFKLVPEKATLSRTGATALTKATMPMPADSTNVGSDTVYATATIVGFKTDLIASESKKENAGAFGAITGFTEAGLYTYKLTEVVPTSPEPGITYDSSEYTVDIYVVNVVDGDGLPVLVDGKPKVTISAITLWKDGNTKETDLGSHDKVDDPEPNYTGGKVDRVITPDETDQTKMESPKATFTNSYPSEKLTVSKTVTGNAADPNKPFTFTFVPTDGYPSDYKYTCKIYNKGTADAVNTVNLTSSDKTFSLTHNQYAEILGVVPDLMYTLTETAVDGYTTSFVQQDNVQGSATKGSTQTGGVAQGKIVSTQGEDSTKVNEDAFTNNKEATTPTGVLLRFAPFVLLAVLLVAGIVFVVINSNKRRKNGYQGL